MSQQDERRPSETVPFQVVQIIAGALILGPLFFAGIAYVTSQGKLPGDPLLAYMAVGFSLFALVASTAVPAVVGSQKLRQFESLGSNISVMDLFGVMQTRVILRSAILEGAAFFCCIAYMVTALWWALVAALALIAVMAIFFPTRGRFDDWVSEVWELPSLNRS